MGASHFVWIGNTPQEIKNQFLPLLKTLSLEWWPVQSFFFPHINQTWGHQKSTDINQILQDDIKVCFWNGIPWAAKSGTSATSRSNNGQAQVLFQIVFLPYIERCGYTEEERLGIHFEELDKMWSVEHGLVIFQGEMHFTSMRVK